MLVTVPLSFSGESKNNRKEVKRKLYKPIHIKMNKSPGLKISGYNAVCTGPEGPDESKNESSL